METEAEETGAREPPDGVGNLDRQRARWRRSRERLGLSDPDVERFSSRGLVKRVESPSARLLVLPADPDAWLVEFDEGFWRWWQGDQPDPTSNGLAQWGQYLKPTSNAAVRSSLIPPNGRGPWQNYLALHRSGALEVELGDDGAGDAYIPAGTQNRVRVFRLTMIVGHVWSALALYSRVRERLQIVGASELTLALERTKSGLLGNFAHGWAEPWDLSTGSHGEPQEEENLLYRRELLDWPSDNQQIAQVAFSIAGWIEDAWGSTARRCFSRGPQGQWMFDSSAHQWRT